MHALRLSEPSYRGEGSETVNRAAVLRDRVCGRNDAVLLPLFCVLDGVDLRNMASFSQTREGCPYLRRVAHCRGRRDAARLPLCDRAGHRVLHKQCRQRGFTVYV